MPKPIYCGSGKKQNDSWITATINVEKIKDYIEDYKGNKFVRININIKDQVDQYGKDVSISINEYKKKEKATGRRDSPYIAPEDKDSGDLPF